MPTPLAATDETLIDQALRAARDTRRLLVEPGARRDARALFSAEFRDARAILVADENTYAAAGADVLQCFTAANHAVDPPVILGPHIYAEWQFVDQIAAALRDGNAIPVAVGSGTINDLTKLAAHRAGRPYMVVATAASMDGYTAYGASITRNGSKQTFDCPAPRVVLADLDVIAAAPAAMNASGYADLMAKTAAGADWILADAAGEEPIDHAAWRAVQGPLAGWLADPACLRHLIYGLLLSGFVMQSTRSSRPASGADHQFSHLWDMQHHTFRGAAPSHGFKVGIGTLASLALYRHLLSLDFPAIDLQDALSRWPSLVQLETRILETFGEGDLASKAIEETRAKYRSSADLLPQLERLQCRWPETRARLEQHLPRFAAVRDQLRLAGCPYEPEQIGISRERLRLSYEQAWYIRRRYTVLDFLWRAGLSEPALGSIFGPHGPWHIN